MVSPSTIVLAKVNTISVHTNIAASTVTDDSLSLNVNDNDDDPVLPDGVYFDDLGHIAAKFSVADLVNRGLEAGEATLTLTGAYTDEYAVEAGVDTFSATDVVRVKE